jgi:hypothetical protein
VQQSVSEPLRQRAAARQHDVAEERFAQVEVGAVDGVDDDLVDAWVFEADDLGIEEDFRGAETLCADLLLLARRGDLVAAWDGMRTLSLLPSGRTYSTIFPSASFPPDHSFSSRFGSAAT